MPTRRRAPVLPVFALAILGCSGSSTAPPPDTGPDPVGTIRTWAGTGSAGFNGEGVFRGDADLYWPADIEFTPTLGTFITDWNNHRIRAVGADGLVRTIVGTNGVGDGPPEPNVGGDLGPDGWPGTDCDLNHPTQVLESVRGTLIVVCWHNHKLREWIPATGNVRVLMGRAPGCTGDGGLASAAVARLDQAPRAVEAPDGTLYINDQRNQCVRRIDAAGIVSTVVGTKVCDQSPGGFGGDNGPPAAALLNMPTGDNPNPPGGGLALDAEGRLYIADTLNHRIRRVDFGADVITTVVGNGVATFAGDGGDPLQASLNEPLDIVFGPDDRLYIADMRNHAVRAVDFAANVITTVAGTGVRGYSGDGGPAAGARLAQPYGLGFDADGHLYIADTYNHRIRRVKMHE